MAFADALSGISGFSGGGGELVRRIVVETVVYSMPLAFGIALVYLIARGGLWDLDFAINRTVVYAALTTVLFGVYFVLVAVVQAIASETFGIRDNTFALVLATAAAAALFLPLRNGLQRLVDQIFFRRRYDLEQTMAGFDERVRTRERVEEIGDDLVVAVEGAFQPTVTEIWLPASSKGGLA